MTADDGATIKDLEERLSSSNFNAADLKDLNTQSAFPETCDDKSVTESKTEYPYSMSAGPESGILFYSGNFMILTLLASSLLCFNSKKICPLLPEIVFNVYVVTFAASER